MFFGGSPWSRMRSTLPTVWCIRSQTAFACGFLAEVVTSLMLHRCIKVWNSGPTNSPPLSWTQRSGQGYLASHNWAYKRAMCSDVLFSILTSSTRLETVSMAVSALNSYGLPLTWTTHGPIKSTAHSLNGMVHISCSGRSPYPLPSNLLHCQCSHCSWLMQRQISLR